MPRQSGYLLLPVIVVITLVAAIALLMNTESALESNTAGSELDVQQAQYVAAAGLNHALWLTQRQGCGPYGDLTDEPLGNDKYTSSLTTDLGGTTSYSSNVDQDTWIRDNHPTTNHGGDSVLQIRYEGGVIERSLLRYDLSPIAAGASVLSATAWFYITNAHAAGPIDIHLTSADWTETDATWDSMNADMDSAVIASIPPQPGVGVWVAANLTGQVQAWINGQPNYGITLNSTSEGVQGVYASRESANPPYLEVVVGSPPTSPALLKATGTLANGVLRSIQRKDVTLRQYPAGFSLSRVTTDSGQDAMLDSFYNNRDYGVHELEVSLGSGSTLEHSLLQFELPAIAPGAGIISAQLELYHYVTARNTGTPVVDLYRVTRGWVEGTHDGTGTADGATWDTWDGSSNWTSAGGDYEALSVASGEVSPATGDWESWEIGELVQGWVDGRYSNHGLLLKGSGDFDISFASREDTDPALHPKLSITYTCACGEVCVAPQGSGKLLMVVVNPSTLVAEDQKAKDLFESWGYTVSVISESANQLTYDSEVALNDVVFISETVNSNSVGTKLVDAPIGVVSQDGDYNPDLGLAPGASLKVGGDIDIVDTDNYITWPFAVGTYRIYSADMEQAIVGGILTADQQTLAEIGGDGSLVVLDKGDAMEGGGNAAGRRVILPLGTRYNFNWDYLNANGRLLVQRALAWGVGADKTSAGNLLLVVPDPASLSAQDVARQALIESWDFSVTLIDDSDTQAAFDAAAGASDVVYVPATVDELALGAKLDDVVAGVVFELPVLSLNFGLSDNDNKGGSDTQVDIIDNTHYITQPFAPGLLTLSTTSFKPTILLGTLAPEMSILAENSSQPSIGALDTGALRYDAVPSPGRRAMLPWGEAVFDPAWLTADGETLMRRAIEWGAVVAPPLPETVLLVVGSDAPLSARDSGVRDLIESWGYTVVVIDDGATQAEFDSAAAAADVVYVSGTIGGGALADKLTGSPTPIVNEFNGKLDNFGFSSSTANSVSADTFSSTNAAHYISEPFAGSAATVFSSSLTMPVPGGTLAPDLVIVGETTGAIAALVTLDSGAQRWDGNPAPARRVHLPFTNAEPSQLTADGEILMRRALEWASDVGSYLGPIAHWKLDDAPGPTAIDSVGGNDATLNGDPAWTTGVADGALEFDGSGDYATTDGNFTPPPVGTVSFWMKVPGSPASQGRILGLDDTWEIRHVTTGTPDGIPYGLVFDLGVTGVNTEFVTTVTVDTPGQWYFVAATYDTNNDAYQVFLDGALHKSGTYPSALAVPAANPLSLGTRTGSTNYFDGTLDDVRIYDYALSASAIADLYAANPPPVAAGYKELYEPWSATSSDTWETVDLSAYGVPPDAVVEVAITNSRAGFERWGGLRSIGSSLDRRMLLQEAEGGGVDSLTMHVQADAGSQIEHYSDNPSDVTFTLLGYWSGANHVYVERFDQFNPGISNAWTPHNLGAYGVGPGQVAEIVIANSNANIARLAGLRPTGAGYERRFLIHEAESGGVDAVTLMVETDPSSNVEVYSVSKADTDYYLVGYWSTPPGTYTSSGGVSGQVSAAATWEPTDLTAFGVPANAIAQFVVSNDATSTAQNMGVRGVGSSLNRLLDLHEAEGGGSDTATLHVNVDAGSQVEWYAESGTVDRFFYPVGWWVLTP